MKLKDVVVCRPSTAVGLAIVAVWAVSVVLGREPGALMHSAVGAVLGYFFGRERPDGEASNAPEAEPRKPDGAG